MKKYLLLTLFISAGQALAQSTPREKAWILHNRLAGVPPKADVLRDMEADIRAGNTFDAAKTAMLHRNFVNITLKNWVKSWSNREQSNRVDFNDHTATLIGMIRDDESFDRVLWDDVYYVVNGSDQAHSPTSNAHYQRAEALRLDFSDPNVLVPSSQTTRLNLPANAVSGVITTRQSGAAFFSAGTNRRVNRFTFMNFLCNDYEQIHDTSVPDYHVGKDVERSPGGDSRTYLNKCVGCHAGQDAIRGAYAYYDFTNNALAYTPNAVVQKINRNVLHSSGKLTVNDEWENLWALPGGKNQGILGFRGLMKGNGAKSLNQVLAGSQAFSSCMAKKVFKLVCMKDPVNTKDKEFVKDNARAFEADSYKMKNLIANTAAGCIDYEE